jgi:hypothetical protein
MNALLQRAVANNNGNGPGPINGRGFAHAKRSPERRLALAVDAALGRPVILTAPQAARLAEIPVSWVVETVKELAETEAALTNGGTTAMAVPTTTFAAETTAVEAVTENVVTENVVTETIAPVTVPDTPAVRNALRRRAAQLGCRIEQITPGEGDGELSFPDCGPYVLLDETGHLIWLGGLPLVGIADALACLAHEHRLPLEEAGNAWKDFGKSWLRSS